MTDEQNAKPTPGKSDSPGGVCDFSRYYHRFPRFRADMRFDVSQHAAFSTEEVLIRLKIRDGKPLDAKPIQPKNGDTVSALMTLGNPL